MTINPNPAPNNFFLANFFTKHVKELNENGELINAIDFVAEAYVVDSFVNTEIIFKFSEVGTVRCKQRFMPRKRPNIKYRNTFQPCTYLYLLPSIG